MACEILVSWPGSEPAFLGLEVQCLNHWTIGEVPVLATWKHHWPFVFQRKPKRCKQPISVQFSSVTQLSLTLCDPMDYSMPGFPVHHQLPECTQTHVHWVSDAIQPPHPLSLPSPPALNLSEHMVFSKESVLRIRWPKYWSFSFNISPSNEHSGVISFWMDWLDLLAVQGTL